MAATTEGKENKDWPEGYLSQASLPTFKAMCYYKANRVVEVEPAYSSFDGSNCGCKVPKSLAVRTHVCSRCHVVRNRDYNSALNHLQNGLQLLQILQLPVERQEFMSVETAKAETAADVEGKEEGKEKESTTL